LGQPCKSFSFAYLKKIARMQLEGSEVCGQKNRGLTVDEDFCLKMFAFVRIRSSSS
jgi:hypothetical protein